MSYTEALEELKTQIEALSKAVSESSAQNIRPDLLDAKLEAIRPILQSIQERIANSFQTHSGEIRHNNEKIEANTKQIERNTSELSRLEKDLESLKETVAQTNSSIGTRRGNFWQGVFASMLASFLIVVLVFLSFAFGDEFLPQWFLDWVAAEFD